MTQKLIKELFITEKISAKINLGNASKEIIFNEINECSFNFKDDDMSVDLNFSEDEDGFSIELNALLFEKSFFFASQNRFYNEDSIVIDIPVNNFRDTNILALYEYKDWWMYPKFITSMNQLPNKTQLVVLEHRDDYVSILSYTDHQFKVDFSGNENLKIHVTTNREGAMQLSGKLLSVSLNKDPYLAVENCAKLLIEYNQSLRQHKKFPELFTKLGWCTWDSFYREVSHDNILKKAEEIKQKNLPIKWVLIDDGWQSVDLNNHKMQSFNFDISKFPEGLKNTIQLLKTKYNIENVGLWHTLSGYWNGLDLKFSDSLNVDILPDNRVHPKISLDSSENFWNEWYKNIEEWGITFSKVDSQSSLKNFYKNVLPIGHSARIVHNQLYSATNTYVDNNVIHCMGMSGDQLWSRKNETIVRTSDDFIPQNKESFKNHAIENVYCSILQSTLSWGDWDMFWTYHPQAQKHSVLRFLSGGPIYISDEVGKTDYSILEPIVDNSGLILRCENVGLPTKDTIFKDPSIDGNVLKLFNNFKDTTFLGIFELNNIESTTFIDYHQLGIPENIEYYIIDLKSKKLEQFKPFKLTLEKEDWKLFAIIPKDVEYTAIGILEKYNLTRTFEIVGKEIHCKYVGTFMFVSEKTPKSVKVNGKDVETISNDYKHTINIKEEGSVITIEY